MRLDFDPKTSAFPYFDNDLNGEINEEKISPKALKMLHKGIEAAREGSRSEAKSMLLRVTEAEPNCEEGWLWLASISEYPEELLIYLNKVLKINPENRQALERSKATKSMLAKTFVERGIDALKQNNADFAKQCFLQALVQDGENETAWLNIAAIADSTEEKISHLNKVLKINPNNADAQNLLLSAKRDAAETLLRKANQAAAAGDKQIAENLLTEILENAPEHENAWMLKCHLVESLDEKISCYQKVLNINPDNQAAKSGLESLQAIMSQIDEESVSAQKNSDEESAAAEPEDLQSSSENGLFAVSENESESPNTQENDSELYEAEAVDSDLLSNYSDSEENDYSLELEVEDAQQFEAEDDSNDADEQLLQVEESVYKPENAEAFEMPSYYEESAEEVSVKEYSQEYSASEYEIEAEGDEGEYQAVQDFEAEPAEADSPGENASDEFRANEETSEVSFNDSDESPAVNACPFCDSENEAQAFKCDSCEAVLTLNDLEMLLAHQDAKPELLGERVQKMEFEKDVRGFDAEELKILAIGEINLRNLRKGFSYLQDAVKLAPNDVMLRSQVNRMAIRLAEIEEQESIHNSMTRGKAILVVDDSATVRKLISSKLEKSGHEVTCAVDGVDALEKIKEMSPDLILLDITMPRMDGYQVCKMMRSDEKTKEIPIVMISGNDGFFDKVRGRMAGTTGYITKPFGPETLMKTVETYLTGEYEESA